MYYDTRSLDYFIFLTFILFCTLLFIYIAHTFHILMLFTHFILHLYTCISLTRNIFPIPDDAVDRRKLGSKLLILNSSFRPHSNFYIVIKMLLKDNMQRIFKHDSFNLAFNL